MPWKIMPGAAMDDHAKQFVIACATVVEEMLPLMPPGMAYDVFDFGLHVTPNKLRSALQERIDQAGERYDEIILGYGLCSLAIAGIHARHSRLIIPRVDDCIAIFLGSRDAFRAQFEHQPGTYYLTRGWIEVGDTPFSDFQRNVEQYGKEKAEMIYDVMMANYTRLALIRTSKTGMESTIAYAQKTAAEFGLAYEEIEGSDTLIRKMLIGPRDDSIVVIKPGQRVKMEQFVLLD